MEARLQHDRERHRETRFVETPEQTDTRWQRNRECSGQASVPLLIATRKVYNLCRMHINLTSFGVTIFCLS